MNMPLVTRVHPKLLDLKVRLGEINDITSAIALLYWDQVTYMPPSGATARGRQMATLQQIAHEKLTDGTIDRLLVALQDYETGLPYNSDEASLLRVTRRISQQATKIPSKFVAKLARHQTQCYEMWAKAQSENNFSLVRPYLETMLDLSRDWANFFPGYDHIADPLIDASDYGMKVVDIRSLFAELRQELVPLVQKITEQESVDDTCLRQHYSEAEQLAFGLKVLAQVGYDFQRGRQDKTLHPFMTTFSIDDVRITTRIYEHDLSQGLFSTIHEMGHALYEQGSALEFEGTPLAGGVPSGLHESQSRLWENMVGRSLSFWRYFYPCLQATFPQQLSHVSLETFYRAINKVVRSLIRTDADEVTYNLHVMIRFDLELALLEGKLSVGDLPEAWNERYRTDLGITPRSDREGILQDVHWYTGQIGGVFQGYTLGNLMSAQFFDAALLEHPQILAEIEQGNFSILLTWLKDNIYRHGRKYTSCELLERVTGRPLSTTSFVQYLHRKYSQLYSL